jgi:MtN3 and saliva related transmembrane protein
LRGALLYRDVQRLATHTRFRSTPTASVQGTKARYARRRMNGIIINLIGYAAVVIGTSLMLPQVVKSFRTKKMDDVSFGTVVLYFFNCLLWLIYSWLIHAWPPVVANAIGLAISVVQIRLKMVYGLRSPS